ncbi:MAG: sugar phosphate isomerase/epimerase [Lachnospiraceae bacterium]|nr:sugar phosphate isomerase/epimerase [Lachnospiraceae bacterium]MBP5746177.1 sugar phosphate isomerase/epimerase [Lachnospiraceae bacterium]
MRLGTSSPLKHDSANQWASNQIKIGCASVVFPVQSNEPEEKIIEYKKAADKAGLMIAEVGIWCNALSPDYDERRKNMDYCVKQLRMADKIGAKCCVNVAGAFGKRWDGAYKENFTKEARNEIIKMIREIIDRAEIKNTYFALEPMPWMIPTGPIDYLRLIDEVERDRFAVHMDVINMVNSIDRYFNPKDLVDECADLLGDRIKSCHIKDIHLCEEYTTMLRECAPGCGEFPIRYYVEKMNEINPDMPMILEHLSTDEDYLKYISYLKEELNGLYKTL